MNIAVLQPVSLTVGDVLIRTNPRFQPKRGQRSLPHVHLTTNLEMGVGEDGGPRFRCALAAKAPVVPEGSDNAGAFLSADDATSVQFPYELEIAVVGVFAFVDGAELDRDAMARLVGFNGISMLYGFARDTVLHYTALASNGPFILPALNMSDHVSHLVDFLRAAEQMNDSVPN